MIALCKRYKVGASFQSRDCCFWNEYNFEIFEKMIEEMDEKERKIFTSSSFYRCGRNPLNKYNNEKIYKFDLKFSAETDKEEFRERLPYGLQPIEFLSMGKEGSEGMEIVKKGVSKGNSALLITGLDEGNKDNTYAFGDSENDYDMIKLCKYGIAMGNGSETLKKIADYVTDDLDSDGIYKALVYYGLISGK